MFRSKLSIEIYSIIHTQNSKRHHHNRHHQQEMLIDQADKKNMSGTQPIQKINEFFFNVTHASNFDRLNKQYHVQ